MAPEGVSFNLAPMVRFVHRSYRLIGLCPYKLPPDINSNHFGVTMPTAIYSIVLATFSMAALTFHAIRDAQEILSRANLVNVSTKFMLAGGVGFHLFYILFTIYVRKSMWNFLREINNIDDKLRLLGVQFNYSRQYWFTQLFTGLWISFAGLLLLIHSYNNLHAFGSISTFFERIFSHFVAVGNYGAFMSEFFFCLLLIYTRFVCLNTAFRTQLLQHDAPKNVDMIVTHFRIVHDAITDAVGKRIIHISLFQAMTCISVTIILAVLSISALYKSLAFREDDTATTIAPHAWTVFFTILALVNVILASFLTSEGRSTSILVHKAMNRDILAGNIRHLRLFSQQLRVRAPLVTCWLYNYDWELIYTMCGTISMYTLIFIQFDILAAEKQRTKYVP
uniref:Gustatory receptor n=1 Tax=Lutzomyia longipalpis TaxID=7200 RepID=A0A240SXZ8_LUTLO